MNRGRLCIHVKDISLITGMGIRYSQKLLKNIKFVLEKQEHQFVTLQEFADYTGIDLELIVRSCR